MRERLGSFKKDLEPNTADSNFTAIAFIKKIHAVKVDLRHLTSEVAKNQKSIISIFSSLLNVQKG